MAIAVQSPFIQILSVPYKNQQGGLGNIIHALDEDGVVWKYQHGKKAWEQIPTKRIGPGEVYNAVPVDHVDDDLPF